MTEIQEAYKEDTVGRHYHTPIVTKRTPMREEKPHPPAIFNITKPMTKDKFKELSDEAKIFYIKHLKEKYNATSSQIAEMLGYNKSYFSTGFIKPLHLNSLFPVGGRSSKKQIADWKKFLRSSRCDENPQEESISEETKQDEEKPINKECDDVVFCDCSFTFKGKMKCLEIAKKINALVQDGTSCRITVSINSLDESVSCC